MNWWPWLIVLVILLVLVVWYLSNTAGRLDRLHHRVEASRDNLNGALERRRDVADHVATIGLLDPASALLVAEAVLVADDQSGADPVARSVAESDLTKVLSAVFADPQEVDEMVDEPGGEVVTRLADACRRVEFGRRFYNDAVFATRAMRSRPVVKLFRLQGSAAMPETLEMSDAPPPGFLGR